MRDNATIGGDEFDGASVMWFATLEDFEATFDDPEFREVVIADGENFVDPSATKQLVCSGEERFDIPPRTT